MFVILRHASVFWVESAVKSIMDDFLARANQMGVKTAMDENNITPVLSRDIILKRLPE